MHWRYSLCMLTDGLQRAPRSLDAPAFQMHTRLLALCTALALHGREYAHAPPPPQAYAPLHPRYHSNVWPQSLCSAALPRDAFFAACLFFYASADCLPQMKLVQASIALAYLLVGADTFGAMPDSPAGGSSGVSHPCILPDDGAAGAAAVMSAESDTTWCGRSDASPAGHAHAECEDMPDAIVGAIFGKGCANLVCDGSMIVSVDPNPTIAQMVKGWCPAKCDGCGNVCQDKPWLMAANKAMFGTPAVATCAAFSVPMPMPATVGAYNLTSGTPCTLTAGLADCDVASKSASPSGCCWWAKEAYMTNPACESLFRNACPSMSGLCGACNGGRRKLDEDADRATVGSLLSSGSFSPKSPIA